ncbi:MAG: hypothetical protein EOP48_17060, partial [Sphingobacteriales bacterium]
MTAQKFLLTVLFGLLISIAPVILKAQDTDNALKELFIRKADTAALKLIKLDFAVPDMPVFKAMG